MEFSRISSSFRRFSMNFWIFTDIIRSHFQIKSGVSMLMRWTNSDAFLKSSIRPNADEHIKRNISSQAMSGRKNPPVMHSNQDVPNSSLIHKLYYIFSLNSLKFMLDYFGLIRVPPHKYAGASINMKNGKWLGSLSMPSRIFGCT